MPSNCFFFLLQKLCRLCHGVWGEKIAEQVRPQITIWSTYILCWMSKVTNTHSEYVILIAFHCNNRQAKPPQLYVLRTLPVSFLLDKCKIYTFTAGRTYNFRTLRLASSQELPGIITLIGSVSTIFGKEQRVEAS